MFDFPDEVDDLNKVPAEYRMLYSDDGKLLDNAKGIRDSLVSLNKTVKNLRDEANRNKKQSNETVTAVNELLGELNLESVDKLKEHVEGLNETIASKSKVNPDKIREEVENSFKKQLSQKDEELTNTRSLMKETVLGRDVAEAVAKHRGNADLLSPYVRSRLAMVEEDGKMHVRVMDADGDYVGDGKGGWQSVDAFVASLKEQPSFHGAFEARGGPGGSGTPPQGQHHQPGAGGGGGSGDGKTSLTPAQKIANGLKNRGFGSQNQRAGASTPPGME